MTEIAFPVGLEARARGAYERGRTRLGLGRARLVAPVAAAAFLQCSAATAFPIALAVALLVALAGLFAWRGLDYARGANAGLVAGLGPFAVPLLSTFTGLFCSETVCVILPATCVAGGLLGGLVLGLGSWGPRESPARFTGASLAGHTLTAALPGARDPVTTE